MTHLRSEELVRWRDAGGSGDRDRILGHLAGCDECRRHYAQLVREKEPAAPPDDLLRDAAARGLGAHGAPAARPRLIPRPAWVLSSLAAALLIGTLAVSLGPRLPGDPPREDLVRGTEIQLLSPTGQIPRDTPFLWSSPVRADHFKVVVLDSSNAIVFAATVRTERLEPGEELWTRLVPHQSYAWSVEAFDEDDRALAASDDQPFTYAPAR